MFQDLATEGKGYVPIMLRRSPPVLGIVYYNVRRCVLFGGTRFGRKSIRFKRSQMARVLIVDDHALVRHALSHLVDSRPDLELCGVAENSTVAKELIRNHDPDLVILDLCLKDSRVEGLNLIAEITSEFPRTVVLVSSMQDESIFATRSLAAGAAGFVSKSDSVSTLSHAISVVLKGGSFLSEAAQRAVDSSSDVADENHGGQLRSLSPRELQIFELVGQGNSPHEIAGQLKIGLKTVDAHRQNIRRKLGLTNMGDVIRQAAIWMASAN